jgi:hypothetical protein
MTMVSGQLPTRDTGCACSACSRTGSMSSRRMCCGKRGAGGSPFLVQGHAAGMGRSCWRFSSAATHPPHARAVSDVGRLACAEQPLRQP